MGKRRRYHPDVANDLAAATAYYDDISVELGNPFRSAVRARFESISEFPQSFGCIHEQVRVAMTKQFPYVILFEDRDESVAILGVFHAEFSQQGWFVRTM